MQFGGIYIFSVLPRSTETLFIMYTSYVVVNIRMFDIIGFFCQ